MPVEARRRLLRDDPERVIKAIYDGISGFGRPGLAPSGRRLPGRRSLVYGEVTPKGVRQLIDALKPRAADVFVDLGSGVGKTVLQAAMDVPGMRCVGVEIDGQRHAGATLGRLLAELLDLAIIGQCELRHESIVTTDLSSATILFANSTCFSESLLHQVARRISRLGRPVTFASFRALDTVPRGLREVDRGSCETSWRESVELYIYRVEPSAR